MSEDRKSQSKETRKLLEDVQAQVGRLFELESRLDNVRSNILQTTDKLIDEYKVAEGKLTHLKDQIAAKIEELKARPVAAQEKLVAGKRGQDTLKLGEISDADMDQKFDALLSSKPEGVRRQYLVKQGDTFKSVAKSLLGDETLAPLIYKINQKTLIAKDERGNDIVDLKPGLEIFLPDHAEIREFKSQARAG